MLSKFIELWSKISDNGINDTLDFDEKKRIRILNKVMFINVALAIIFSSLDAANLQIEGALVSLSPITLSVVFLVVDQEGILRRSQMGNLDFYYHLYLIDLYRVRFEIRDDRLFYTGSINSNATI